MKRHRAMPSANLKPGLETGEATERLRARYGELVDGLLELSATVEEKLRLLEDKESWWSRTRAEVEKNFEAAQSRIELNVGGRVFATTRATLMRWENTYFHAMLGSAWEPCHSGCYFIDRNPSHFERIIEAMRSGESVDAEGLTERQAARLAEECDYFQLPRSTFAAPRWDPCHCSADLTLSEESRVAARTRGNDGYKAVLATAAVARFKVRVLSLSAGGGVLVGYATASGWFLQCSNGSLWSTYGDVGRAYCEPLQVGDILEVIFDEGSQQISFAVNGIDHGVAFTGVYSEDGALFPCVELEGLDSSIRLED